MDLRLSTRGLARRESDRSHLADTLYPRVASVLTSTWFLALFLLALTWPVTATLTPVGAGLDNSFWAGMYLAAHGGLHFGTDLVVTYGPLGFLRWPALYYPGLARLSVSYVVIQQLLLCATLMWSLRRTFSLPVAFVIVLVTAGVATNVGPHELSLMIAFVWAVEVMRADAHPLARKLFPFAAGVFAGVEVLVKLNTGFTVLLVVVITCVALERERLRTLGLFVLSFLVTASACWFAAGQTVGNVVDFITASRQMISGWSTVMMLSDPMDRWELWAALAVVLVVWRCALEATTLQPSRVRIAVCLLWAIVAYSVFKEGFVRQDIGHTSIFFATALAASMAFTWRRSQSRTMLLSIVVLAMAFFGASRTDPFAPVSSATAHVGTISDTAALMVSSHRRTAVVARARRALTLGYGFDPTLLRLVGSRSAQVLSAETSLIWLYQLHWRPVPVFEPYVAYTTALDNRNRDALVSHGSERIIRDADAPVDGRNGQFDAPAMQLALFCHYMQLGANSRWQVLGRVPNRCGLPRLLASVRAAWGDTVRVPAPRTAHAAVFVRIGGAGVTGLGRLKALLYRAQVRYIVLNGIRVYRFVPGTAADGTLISIPKGADYSPPFAIAPNSQTISVAKAGDVPRALIGTRPLGASPAEPRASGRPLTYSFYELPIRSGPRRR